MKMDISRTESSFTATAEKGEVSSILLRPSGAKWCFVFGHGASIDIHHPSIVSNAECIAAAGVAVFRFNFPYSEAGGGGLNGRKVLLETIRSAAKAAAELCPDLKLIAGGRSMGGRMTSLAQEEAPLPGVAGLLLLAFPLHPAKKPDDTRAEHLKAIKIPMLFVSGTRDPLADMTLMEPMVNGLGSKARLQIVDDGDHGFKVLKRTGVPQEQVWEEIGRQVATWTEGL